MTTGRIDVHSHLLPGVDDGCETVADSLACGRLLVRAGYSHAFCTPHIWPSLPDNTVETIPIRTAALQAEFDQAGVPLKLLPGGELNLRPEMRNLSLQRVVTYNLAGKYCIFDLWADQLPSFFEPTVRHLQSLGLKVIIAHPERMRAVQDEPELADDLAEMGLLLQGNLQCFSDPLRSDTRRTVERFLQEDRYFLLGSDTHNPETLPCRLDGLNRAIELVGADKVNQLTIENPALLL